VFAFQLAVYAAAGRAEGLKVEAAYLHELSTSIRKAVPVGLTVTNAATARANALIAGVVNKRFPAKPEEENCPKCDVRAVCKHAACDKRDF